MLNYIWAGMIVVAVGYGIATGNIGDVGNEAVESAKEAVELCITMLGIMSLWMGLMEVARTAGVIQRLEKWMNPLIKWLFPNLPKEHNARTHIATNIVANLLGLGWAATPAGLRAMEELAKHPVGRQEIGTNNSRRKAKEFGEHIATDEMCTFLILNISSLQLIPVTIIAFRSQFGADNPSAIVLPAIIATSVSTGVGVLYCKLKSRRRRNYGKPEKY